MFPNLKVPMPSAAIHVLDTGFVRLIDYMGTDLSIVRAARASFDASWRAGADEGSDQKLIKYLYANNHNTPFESVVFQFEVYAPIFVFRQWHRHRTQSYNELSARYRELPAVWYTPRFNHIGVQSKNNKQASEFPLLSPEEKRARLEEIELYDATMVTEFKTYQKLLKCGWPRERARAVLGTAVYSHMFAKVDLHNLFKFMDERSSPDAQFEIREYSGAIHRLIRECVPVAYREYMRGVLLKEKIAAAIAANPQHFEVSTPDVEAAIERRYP